MSAKERTAEHEAARAAVRAHQLIEAFRMRGHTEARLDPLGKPHAPPSRDLRPPRPVYGIGQHV